MASDKNKDNKYQPPLKIEGDLNDVLKASFDGKPESLESEKGSKNTNKKDKGDD